MYYEYKSSFNKYFNKGLHDKMLEENKRGIKKH